MINKEKQLREEIEEMLVYYATNIITGNYIDAVNDIEDLIKREVKEAVYGFAALVFDDTDYLDAPEVQEWFNEIFQEYNIKE